MSRVIGEFPVPINEYGHNYFGANISLFPFLANPIPASDEDILFGGSASAIYHVLQLLISASVAGNYTFVVGTQELTFTLQANVTLPIDFVPYCMSGNGVPTFVVRNHQGVPVTVTGTIIYAALPYLGV